MNLIRLSGLTFGADIDIVFTGVRPGEKICEELLTETDQVRATHHERIYVYKEENLDVSKTLALIEELVKQVGRQHASGLKRLLQEVVPEYHPTGVSSMGIKPAPLSGAFNQAH